MKYFTGCSYPNAGPCSWSWCSVIPGVQPGLTRPLRAAYSIQVIPIWNLHAAVSWDGYFPSPKDTVQRPESYIPDHLEKDISIYLILYVIHVHNMKYEIGLKELSSALPPSPWILSWPTAARLCGTSSVNWIVSYISPARRAASRHTRIHGLR